MANIDQRANASAGGLARSLKLWHAVLYGLGVTVGAGIYVLIGAAADRAGLAAPLAFVVAAVVMAFTGASYAELGGRFPVAAGAAAYVGAGYRSRVAALLTGVLVIAIAVISGAAISVGAAGYISVFVPLPRPLLITAVVLAMGLVAAWGIRESVTFAGIMTLTEIGGLLILVAAGLVTEPGVVTRLPEMMPALEPAALGGVLSATMLAIFAFIGFESLANIAEEVEAPERTLPIAIALTLIVSTLLYVAVVWVAVVAVPRDELAASEAPLALVFTRLTGQSPLTMSAIAIVATLNGIIVQMILAARVMYGLARQGVLPRGLAGVHPVTRTPLAATATGVAMLLVFALAVPLADLADITSRITLVVFALVNVALIRLKRRREPLPAGIFQVPEWVPWAGALSCLVFLVVDLA